MMKVRLIKKIKISRLVAWQIFIVALLLLSMVMLFLNIYALRNIRKELESSIVADYNPVRVDVDLFGKVIMDLEKKESIFNKIILEKSSVEDPSL